MNHKFCFLLGIASLCFFACKPETEKKAAANETPGVEIPKSATDSAGVHITNLNYYRLSQHFAVVGIANSHSSKWRVPYLKVTFFDASGQPVKLNGKPEIHLKTYAEYIMPMGRSSFAGKWGISSFSAEPVRAEVVPVSSEPSWPGCILIARDVHAIKYMRSIRPDTFAVEEAGRNISGIISNPLPFVAHQPKIELLGFGNDQKLWVVDTTSIDGSNPYIVVSKKNPIMEPGEERTVNMQIPIEALPLPLVEAGIGWFEMLPFEKKQKSPEK